MTYTPGPRLPVGVDVNGAAEHRAARRAGSVPRAAHRGLAILGSLLLPALFLADEDGPGGCQTTSTLEALGPRAGCVTGAGLALTAEAANWRSPPVVVSGQRSAESHAGSLGEVGK